MVVCFCRACVAGSLSVACALPDWLGCSLFEKPSVFCFDFFTADRESAPPRGARGLCAVGIKAASCSDGMGPSHMAFFFSWGGKQARAGEQRKPHFLRGGYTSTGIVSKFCGGAVIHTAQ